MCVILAQQRARGRAVRSHTPRTMQRRRQYKNVTGPTFEIEGLLTRGKLIDIMADCEAALAPRAELALLHRAGGGIDVMRSNRRKQLLFRTSVHKPGVIGSTCAVDTWPHLTGDERAAWKDSNEILFRGATRLTLVLILCTQDPAWTIEEVREIVKVFELAGLKQHKHGRQRDVMKQSSIAALSSLT